VSRETAKSSGFDVEALGADGQANRDHDNRDDDNRQYQHAVDQRLIQPQSSSPGAPYFTWAFRFGVTQDFE
jgi:hypothetical protein